MRRMMASRAEPARTGADVGDMPPVVILCGGMGTRLREETDVRPKPMVSIGERPILWHIMKLYSHYGCNRFVLALGYKGHVIRDYFVNYDLMNSDLRVCIGSRAVEVIGRNHDEERWEVTLAETGQHTMTGGRVKALAPHIGDQTFMATYGDGVADVDVRALLDFHRRAGKLATVTAVHPVARFGELTLRDDAVQSFREKPQTEQGWINGGFFVFEPAVLDLVDGPDTVLEQAPLERLAASGQLAVYRHPGYWQCMDTQRDMLHLNEAWTSNRAPWRVWED